MKKIYILFIWFSLTSCIGSGLIINGDYDPMYYTPYNRVYQPHIPYYVPQQNYFYYQPYYFIPNNQKPTKEIKNPTIKNLNRGRDN